MRSTDLHIAPHSPWSSRTSQIRKVSHMQEKKLDRKIRILLAHSVDENLNMSGHQSSSSNQRGTIKDHHLWAILRDHKNGPKSVHVTGNC